MLKKCGWYLFFICFSIRPSYHDDAVKIVDGNISVARVAISGASLVFHFGRNPQYPLQEPGQGLSLAELKDRAESLKSSNEEVEKTFYGLYSK